MITRRIPMGNARRVRMAIVLGALVFTPTIDAQDLFNKRFAYESFMGNLEPVTGPSGYLFCSTVRFGLGNIDGFQFTRLDSTGSVLGTKAFTTGPLTNVMQYGSLARLRSDGTYSFLFGSRIGSGYKWSIRLFNSSPQGAMNWNRKLEYVNPDYSIYFIGAMEQAFEETPDGGYLITGLRKKPSSSQTDTVSPMIVKLDGVGNVLWNKSYDLGQMCGWHIVSQVGPSGETLFGFHADTPCMTISDNCLLTRIDPNGNTLWSKRVNGLHGMFTGTAMRNGNYVVSARDSSSLYLLELDTTGTPVWGMRYALSFSLSSWNMTVVPTMDRGFLLTASMPDSTGYFPDIYYFKVDSAGSVQWERLYGNENSGALIDLEANNDSTFTMLSMRQEGPFHWHMFYLSKLDSLGLNGCITPVDAILSAMPFSFSTIDVVLNEISPAFISQSAYVNDSTAYDPTMIESCSWPVNISEPEQGVELLVYPNPTSGKIWIKANREMQGGTLTIHDLVGRRMLSTTLLSSRTTIDLQGLPNGVYVYHAFASTGQHVSGRIIRE